MGKKIKFNFTKICHHQTFRKTVMIIGLAVVVLGLAIFAYNYYYRDKIFPRTYVGGLALGGKTKDEAQLAIAQALGDNPGEEIKLQYQDKTWLLKKSDLDLSYDAASSAKIAWEIGRHGTFGQIVAQQLKSILGRNRKPLSFNYNKSVLNDAILRLAGAINIEEKDATVKIKNRQGEVLSEKTGQKLDFEQTKNQILQTLGNFRQKSALNLVVSVVRPKITAQGAASAAHDVAQILALSVTLRADTQTYTLNPDDIASFLVFVGQVQKKEKQKIDLKKGQKDDQLAWVLKVQVDPGKAAEYVKSIASEVYQEPKDAKFEMQNGKAIAFQLSQTGYELDREKTAALLSAAILGSKKEIQLPIKITEPEVASNSAAELGIKELVGEGTTNFSGSPQNRRHNIAVGAAAFHGVLLRPGEEFSMLKYLGPVEASTGYLPELVIKEDRTIPEYGGGLCQVSTTMFRAALNGGLKISERQSHSYRVRYYEPPVGMDATIYIPKPDFKFVNDFSSYLLIQTEVDDNDLTFRFYGTKDGRRSETTDPYVYDVIGSGEPIYTESPDLAPGEIKRIETAHPGSKASFKYSVFDRDNKLMHEETFNSSYVPWPARYLYGPGTTIPPVE